MAVKDGFVAKFQPFESEAEAQAHVEALAEKYPAAFVAEAPEGNPWQWAVDGETLTYEAPAPVVPSCVTPLQARRALRAAGLLGTVNAWVAQQTDPDIKDAWEYASVIERHGPLTLGAAAALGLSDQQLDALFTAAAQV